MIQQPVKLFNSSHMEEIFSWAYEEKRVEQRDDVFVPIAQVNGGRVGNDSEDEAEDYDEFGPLVMDTPPLVMDTPSLVMDTPPLAPPTPEPPKTAAQATPTTQSQRNSPISIKPISNHFSGSASTPDLSSLAHLQDLTNQTLQPHLESVSSIASVASSNHSDDCPSPRLPSLQDPAKADDSSPLSSNSSSRRGSKSVDEGNGEIDGDDSDFDDLDEFITELVRLKILPVSGEDGDKFICPICNTSLLNLHDLTVHIRSHNNNNTGTTTNTCKICGKILSSQSSLDRHMLVHSGERPFCCKVCNMSFTTNGNMHRHSRIHTKEENMNALVGSKFHMRRSKSVWRHRINSFLSQAQGPIAERMKHQFPPGRLDMPPDMPLVNALPNHSSQSVFSRPTENMRPQLLSGMKRPYEGSDYSMDWHSPFKRQSLSRGSDGESSDTSPSKYEYQLLPNRDEEQVVPLDTKESRDDKEDKDAVLNCPVCPKSFMCKYGLETHLETHPNYNTSQCSECRLTFETPRNLQMHQLMMHHAKGSTVKESPNKENNDNLSLSVGFQDLSFVDFAVEKFPLIAKHFCEENTRSTSSAYLNFTCNVCSKAFPCETSLILHSYTHGTDKTTRCPLCECDYTSVNELHIHMLKHLSDKAFAEIRPSLHNEKGDDDLMPDSLNKQDFLAMFELKGNEEDLKPSPVVKPASETVKPPTIERNINNEYFAKLGQAFMPGISPIPPLFNNVSMFRPGQQPSLDDFHKMLQIATNMNMLPSMGPSLLAPGLVSAAHSSPSKLPMHLPPHVSIPPPTLGLGLPNTTLAHGGLLAPGKTTPLTDGNFADSSDIDSKSAPNFQQFSCRYCDQALPSYKALKSHIRSHLGMSPYKCNLCVYSSSDKSTLIRHLRTHNGERPYMCLICDFAFTTKANCDRHLRKRHQKTERDDIEMCIGFNKLALDPNVTMESFHSPDTVCRYCGIDFRFFRDLKHHMRVDSSCRRKPYQCQLCAIGFCTKANSLRHIQKQHPGINDNQIENYIKFIEHFPNDDGDAFSDISDEGIPLYSDELANPLPLDMRSENTTPQPPAAHSTPKPEGLLQCDSRHSSRHVSPSRHISPLQSPMAIKTEPTDRSGDQPLDFSVRTGTDLVIKKEVEEPAPASPVLEPTARDEAPMDLSVKKPWTNGPIPIAPKPSVELGNVFQCIYCPMGYSDTVSLQCHMRHQHGHQAGVDNPILSSRLAGLAGFNRPRISDVMPSSSAASSAPMISNFQYVPNKGIFHARPIRPRVKTSLQTIQNLQDKLRQNAHHESPVRTSNGTDGDLASVTRMIDVTAPLNFQAFFSPDNMDDSPSQSVGPIGPLAHLKSGAIPGMPDLIRRPGVQISLEHAKAINRELDNLQKEGDVDEVALSQVREMALSVKEECTISSQNVPVTSSGSGGIVAAMESTCNSTSPVGSQNGSLGHEDENSGDGQKIDGDISKGDGAPIKKKRNSYADSPHKLSCPYCPRAFPWVSSLTRHLLTHTGQKPFKCPRCPVTFSTKSNRERHLIRKHGVNMLDPLSRQTMDRPYKCPLCVFSSFSTQSNLLKHYRDRHNGVNLPESISDIEKMSPAAIKAATLEMEMRASENPPLIDDSGAMDLTNEDEDDDLDNSVDSSEKLDDDAGSYMEMELPDDIPPAADKEADLVAVAPHLRGLRDILPKPAMEYNPLPMFKPVENLPTFKPVEKPVSPQANGPTVDIAKIIAEQKALIEQKQALEIQIQTEIRSQIDAQRRGETKSASPVPVSQRFDSPDLVIDLQKPFTGSAEKVINPERDNYDVDKITECWKCNEAFTSRKILVRHLKEHSIDLPYKCYLCDASFNVRLKCLSHQENSHHADWSILKEKNKVGDTVQFSAHMDKVVENNCNKLDSGSILEIPGTGMDESKMEVISADYMQRKVYCSLCPKRFWSLQDLRRHMRSHTGERPFECDICQKRFTLKHSMMRHRKKHAGAPHRTFDDDDDSNPGDENKSHKKLAPSRNVPIYPRPVPLTGGLPLGTGLPFRNDLLPLTNTYLFGPGFSGGSLALGTPLNMGRNPVTSHQGTPPPCMTLPMSVAPMSVAATASFIAAQSRTPLPSIATSPSVSQTSNTGSNGDGEMVSNDKPSIKTAKVEPTPGKNEPAPTLDSVKKEFLDCSADILHNLLGVESAEIEKMLDSRSADKAAHYLGVNEGS